MAQIRFVAGQRPSSHSDYERLCVAERARMDAASDGIYFATWGIPSPDGRHIAISGVSAEANAWMIDN